MCRKRQSRSWNLNITIDETTVIPLLSIFFLVTSCKEDKEDQFARLVQEWQGKERSCFPRDMAFTRFVTEQVEYRIPDAEYKVLIYVDSTGCTSCKLQLPKWKN